MKFVSTRGEAQSLGFSDAVLTGLASDGGLYVPEALPQFSQQQISAWAGLDYPALMYEIISPFVGDEIPSGDLIEIIDRSYQKFNHVGYAPLIQLDKNQWVLELFHGPTLAFKDFALQFLGQLLDYILKSRNQKVVILGATSGDTGSAAIQGCRGCDNIDIVILHPHQRVSEVQRRQMTTVLADNVFNIALDGNFDDCQNIVKRSFQDQSFLPENRQLVAVNSINWARIMAQIVYYFYSALELGSPHRVVSYSVPTGNFGDIYAGYLAKKMGLPIEQLIIATNVNDILHRCISDNDHSVNTLQKSLSPSMDIMVSSNFERLLFDLSDHDGAQVTQMMHDLRAGKMVLSNTLLGRARGVFSSARVDDQQTLDMMQLVAKQSGYLLDPHSAIGVAAARQCATAAQVPVVCMATAHPAKFADAVEAAGLTMRAAELPDQVSNLMGLPERVEVLANSVTAVHKFVAENCRF
jgi:threonine synthase